MADSCARSVRWRPPSKAAFVAFVLLGLLASVALGACGANVNVRVLVGQSGSGSVTLSLAFPRSTTAQIEDLKYGLPVADLRAAGWVVKGPGPGPAGTTVVSASHAFANLGQLPALVADIAGNGPEADRPFRLAVNEVPSFLQTSYTATGSVDLRCSLSCFDDPKLAASVGYALGMPTSEVHQLIADPAKDVQFQFELVLPGRVTSSNAGAKVIDDGPGSDGALVWSPVLGEATTVAASSAVVDTTKVDALGIAVAAGAIIVSLTAAYIVLTGRRRRRRGGLRFR